jgi:hypothetical protein
VWRRRRVEEEEGGEKMKTDQPSKQGRTTVFNEWKEREKGLARGSIPSLYMGGGGGWREDEVPPTKQPSESERRERRPNHRKQQQQQQKARARGPRINEKVVKV